MKVRKKRYGFSALLLLFALTLFGQQARQPFELLTYPDSAKNEPLIQLNEKDTFRVVLKKNVQTDLDTILLSPFVNSAGKTTDLLLLEINQITEQDSVEAYLQLLIVAKQIDTGKDYVGSILIYQKSGKQQSIPIRIKRISLAKNAEVEVYPANLPLVITDSETQFSFNIKENSGIGPATDVKFSLTESPDAKMSFIFWRKGVSSQPIKLDAGETAAIMAQASNIPLGKHQLKFKVSARTANPEKVEELNVTIIRKRGLWLSIAVIIGAVLFTIITKKFVDIRNTRLELRRKAQKIKESVGTNNSYNAANSRLRRMLKMISDFSRNSITNFEIYREELKLAEELATYLGKLNVIHRMIRRQMNGMKRRRVEKNCNSIINELAHLKFTEAEKSAIDNRINRLNAWFASPDGFDKLYEEDLVKDIEILKSIIDLKQFDQEYVLIPQLFEVMNDNFLDDKDNKVEVTAVERENAYAALKIFWEKRKSDEFQQLYSAFAKKSDINDLFEVTDRINWGQVVELSNEGKLKLSLIQSANDSLETYTPLIFNVESLEPGKTDNYLYKHGLTWEWDVTIKQTGKNSKEKWIQVKSDVPEVTLFSPIKGALEASVSISYKGDTLSLQLNKSIQRQPKIVKTANSIFNFETNVTEMIKLIAAIFVAILTGILSFYYQDDFYGTFKDQIILFLWGAGIEQSTTFLGYLNKGAEA